MKMTKEEAFKMLQGKKVYAGEFTKEVQEKLFEIGFEWFSSGKQIMEYKFIITFSEVLQTCPNYKNFIEYFDNQEELTISQILGIELEDEFKDGDICYSYNGACKMIFIYKKSTNKQAIDYYACFVIEDYELLLNDWCDTSGNIRHATDQEKQTLFNELDKQGYRWNAEEKKLEKKLWRAKNNGTYYYLGENSYVKSDDEKGYGFQSIRYENGNYFKTEQEAQEYADKIKDLLKNR